MRLPMPTMTILAALTGTAVAQTAPAMYLENATVVGAGSTVTITRVPVLVAGQVVYRDISLGFAVGPTGAVTLAAGAPRVTPSPVLLSGNFVAGKYLGAGGAGGAAIVVSGPGVGVGGTTQWSLGAPLVTQDTPVPAATWYAGSPAAGPLAPRLKAAGITSTAFSYGVAGASSANDYFYGFAPGCLLGFAQTGGALTVVSFTRNGADYPTPQYQVTYTLTR